MATPATAALAMLAALAIGPLAACLGPGDFRCTSHDQCGPAGLCEPSGQCSVTDPQCDSGRRYVAHAGAALSGQCVGDACPADPIAELRAGASHACVLRRGGTVWCWGANADGQLGDGTTTPRAAAVPVPGLTDATTIALGERHSCAVRADGSLWCWGANADGQLGDDSPGRLSPGAVAGISGVTAIAAGSSSSCALTSDGRVSCWGSNAHGQLGDGSGVSHTAPVQVFALTGARRIVSRWQHACALRDDETLWCWGSNGSGQLGDGTTTDQPRPVKVTGLGAVTDVATGLQHTCASTRVDGLWCWGDNSSGQLGQTDVALEPRPAAVTSIPDPIDITAGLQHSCAVRKNGGAWCWGNNRSGQLGEGTTGNLNVPVPVTDLTHVLEMDGGERFTCARRDDQTVWCWGDNHLGQLGLGSAVIRPTPFPVPNITGAVDLTAGGSHTCAVLGAARDVVCWGSDQAGQLGDNSTADRATPAATKPPLHARAIAAGGFHTCAPAEDAESGGDSGVWCWGRGSSGQLGPRSLVDSSVPIQALGPEAGRTAAVAAGDAHTCALLAGDGTVACWGENGDGQLGDGTAIDRATPAAVLSLSGAQQLAAGGGHTCALGGDGTVWCWGRDDFGQLGDGGTDSRSVPRAVALVDDGAGAGAPLTATGIAAGGLHACALLDGGAVWCWGRGDSGQLGVDTLPPSATAAPVSWLPAASAVSAGAAHSCALGGDGTVWCWGANESGQLGGGAASAPVPVAATAVPALSGAVQIATGASHTCARRGDGTIWCWGSNSGGQLGDGVILQRNTPELDRLACP